MNTYFARASFLILATAASAQALCQAPLLPGTMTEVPFASTASPTGELLRSYTDMIYGRGDTPGITFYVHFTSEVWRQTDGTLSFVYLLEHMSSGAEPIQRFSVGGYSNFSGFSVSVEQGGSPAEGVPASSASRTASGKTVSFDYGAGTLFGPIVPNQSSRYVTVYTDAIYYAGNGTVSILGDGVTAGNVFVPTSIPPSVPEPASMAALGLGAVALLRRRKKG